MAARALLLAGLAATAAALYSSSDDVLQLTEKDFDKTVLKSPGLYLVEFYAPWCGHCKNLAPAWKQAAKALKGVVHVVAVDATESQGLASKYGVQGFPTIKLFADNKGSPIDYQGARDAPSIVNWALGQAQSVVKARLSGKAAGKGDAKAGKKTDAGSKGSTNKGGNGGNTKRDSETGGGKHVVTLTPDNFDDLVLNSGDAWMVEFYAPWCGHCKALAPEWASAAAKTADEGGVKFGAVDADQHKDLAARFSIRGFPTIKMFPAGASSDSAAKDYNGPRAAGDLVEAALKLADASAGSGGGVGKVHELTGRDQWAELCGGGSGGKKQAVCVAAVLPHILDDGANKRNARLAALAEAAGKSRGKLPVKFVWWEVGAHPKLEEALGVGMTPALYAVAQAKGVFTPYKGALEAGGVAAFVTGLTTPKGAAGATPFPKGFDVEAAVAKSVPAWDGKDGKPPAEEPLDAEL